MDKFPPGIRPDGAGLRIRIWKNGRLAYSETIQGDPGSEAVRARAVRRREYLAHRIKYDLPIDGESSPAPPFHEVAQDWLNIQAANVDRDTIRRYRTILQSQWIPLLANTEVDRISRADIKRGLASFGVKIKTQKNYLGPLRMVLDHAQVQPNPANKMDWPRKKSRTEKPRVSRFLPAERAAVVGALDDLHDIRPSHWTEQARIFFPLLFATGLRPGEALALRWSDWDGQCLRISATHTRNRRKEHTKTGVDRSVYLPTWARGRLEGHSTRFAGGPVFVGQRGAPLTDTKRLNPIWHKALGRARLPSRDPYVCRHTRAAELLSIGVNQAEAAAQLGHNVQMFSTLYSEWIDEYAGRRDYSHLEGNTDESPTNSVRLPENTAKSTS